MVDLDELERKAEAAAPELGVIVECASCGLRKAPRGRSVAPATAGSLCDWECPGYSAEPIPGDLWPGESRVEFGFPLAAREAAEERMKAFHEAANTTTVRELIRRVRNAERDAYRLARVLGTAGIDSRNHRAWDLVAELFPSLKLAQEIQGMLKRYAPDADEPAREGGSKTNV